ncbi:MAG TPA: hypothetical protein VMJ32_02315 [Pirellulales bacterium]|nr:hypothetical protein [Pirellulales bacterium]
MDAVPLAIGCLPLSAYLFFVGMVNLRRRPTVVAGHADVAGLAFAVCGLVIVGPMNLFLPASAAVRFGPFAWCLLLGFYILCVLLYAMLARPRLVIFNITPQQLRPVLETAARRLDSDTKLAGDALQLPQMQMQFYLDVVATMRNVSIVAIGNRQSYAGWKRLQYELASDLAAIQTTSNPRGFTFLACSLALFGWPLALLLHTTPPEVAQQLRDILRM